MKVWEHLVHGGRVGFCFFDAKHWSAHETEKKDGMLRYSSPIESLLVQLSALRPSSMACPPNIWAGLYSRYLVELAVLRARGEAAVATTTVQTSSGGEWNTRALKKTAALLGGRMKNMATGGAPTPAHHIRFAKALCQYACFSQGQGATFVESYGTTEAGPITMNNRQLSPKLATVALRLVERPDLGFTSSDQPHPRGEVWVKSETLSLGYYGDPVNDRKAFFTVGKKKDMVGGGSTAVSVGGVVISPPLAEGRWYKTGDLASIDHTGCVRLIERVSALVSTRCGCIVTPTQLETVLGERLSLPGERYERCLVHVDAAEDTVVILLVSARGNVEGGGGGGGGVLGGGRGRRIAPPSDELAAELAAMASPPLAADGSDFIWVQLPFGAWTRGNGMVSGELKTRRKAVVVAYAALLDAARRLVV
jgi:acyl-CoA synthetase (AMP-forming)/AMP-acid ligase II